MVSVTRPAVCMQQVLSAHIMELYVKKVSTVTREKKTATTAGCRRTRQRLTAAVSTGVRESITDT